MKKLLCFLLAFSSLLCMGACNKDNTSKVKLSYGEKYISSYQVGAENFSYYIFEKDGTAEYHYYWFYAVSYTHSYTISLKYQIVEEENMVFCFYDGIEYDAVDTQKKDERDFIAKLMYTEDFLVQTSGDTFIAESYLEEIPNFGN